MAIQDIFDAILAFNGETVAGLVQEEIDAQTDISAILDAGLIRAMDEVGRQFSAGDLFVPEMLRAAKAMKTGLDVLKPHLATGEGPKSRGTIVIGTVKGDLHDIGKNLVTMMLEGSGFEVIDLGVDVDKEQFVAAAVDHKTDLVGLSALLTTTMPAMEETISALKESELKVKIMVGGAPVSRKFSDKIGAHGFAEDAADAVEVARKLIAG